MHLVRRDAEALLNRLRNWETMTWHQILGQGPRNHLVPVDRCSKQARDRLRHLERDDVDELLSMVVNSRARVWSILTDRVCYFLWWDPDHQVCPSKKKHT